SLARYFIQQGGKRKFVAYVGEGMQTNNWPAATRKFYGFNDLSDLQLTWVEWVRQGSPQLPDNAALVSAAAVPTTSSAMVAGTQMASLTQQPQARNPEGPRAGWQTIQAQNARIMARADQNQTPPTPTSFAAAAP